jgi:hypothetical protein
LVYCGYVRAAAKLLVDLVVARADARLRLDDGDGGTPAPTPPSAGGHNAVHPAARSLAEKLLCVRGRAELQFEREWHTVADVFVAVKDAKVPLPEVRGMGKVNGAEMMDRDCGGP